jgi:hypothetical protein
MLESDRSRWPSDHAALWDRIERHVFDGEHALNFVNRLARDHRWSLPFSRGAILEYRRFCFLAVTGPTPVTPSEQVDEVWHLHLTYSRDYWEIWCGNVLRKPLHHDPTLGGPAERDKYRSQYAATLSRYEHVFGPPSVAFWPATHDRFRPTPRYQILDRDRYVTAPWPSALFQRIQLFGRTLLH